ncbi:MAG: hypothetical protein K2Q22_15200, partial [Cytophagales bacterium]|nr:hypothetical protein [Cytophagales bacterium]
LGVFRKSNIDKPAYVGEYSVKDTPMDNGHTVRTYAALKDNLSVKYQQIEFDQKGNPTKIASASEDKNFLYFTKKEVVAEFEAVGGKNRLKNYGVNILQKIICLDTFKMKVEARIK